MDWRTAFSSCSVAIALLALPGCGTVYLHSDTRQKQGEDASKAWDEVDLKSTFKTERDNLSKLLEAELQTQDRLALTVRNAELRKMLASRNPLPLSDAMSRRLVALAGPDARTKAWLVANNHLKTNATEQKDNRDFLAATGAPDVSCEELTKSADDPGAFQKWAKSNPDAASLAKVPLSKLRSLCKTAPQLKKNLDAAVAALGGRIEVAVGELAAIRAEIETARKSRNDAEAAIKAHEEAVKARNEATGDADKQKKATDSVAEAAKKLQKALGVVAQAQDAFSKEIVAKERISKLEKALIDIASNAKGNPPEGATDAVVVAVLLPQILDDARAISRAGRVPETLPLLIRLNLERLRLEAATREVKSLEAQAELSQAIVDVLIEQAARLNQELDFLNTSPASNLASGSLLDAFSAAEAAARDSTSANAKDGKPKADPKKDVASRKEALYRAAAQYLDAVGRMDARYYRLEYMRIAAVHEQSLSRSEVNAAQWEALIDSTVKQAAQHAAGGLKASDFTGLIQALGILWIGHGTNK